MAGNLIRGSEDRKNRVIDKQNAVLRFLKDEIYSSTENLGTLLYLQRRATVRTLNRMVDQGLLIADKVSFIGSSAVEIWGISSEGMLAILTPEEITSGSLRTYSAGRISPRTIEHTLDIHRVRLHYEQYKGCKKWQPTRLLPGHSEKRGHNSRWHCYPDSIGWKDMENGSVKAIAFEIERTRKTPQRYVQLLKSHIRNMEEDRYQRVCYYCLTIKKAEALKALFHRLIDDKQMHLYLSEDERYGPDMVKRTFVFLSLESFEALNL